jgi:hypothetical protein
MSSVAVFGTCDIRYDYFLNGKAKQLIGSTANNLPDTSEAVDQWMEMKIKVEMGQVAGSAQKKQNTNPRRTTHNFGALRPDDTKPVSIQFNVPAGAKLTLRSIKLKSSGGTPLFNGKDLAGWKVFDDSKRNKSQWTVSKEGWLNVKNGPGDLQTEKKFDNFILQLECISNGKALNSGVFFRCVADEYQNGYEAQVHNGFKDNDRTKPTDFGTGAIYRRVAARKVVPNDNEWFTMTVLAHGKHFATWVNGYQTVDWTDERKDNDNPRNGYRAAAGHLSIQGHDPTTDLSFRNIRIVELKK